MSPDDVTIDVAGAGDVAGINAVFNRYVAGSHVSFDTEPWTDERRLDWLVTRMADGYTVLVARADDRVIGTAWSGPWRGKDAYSTSVETTIYLAPDHMASGVATRLYRELIDTLSAGGIHRCYAIIALPNDASVAFHHRLGFNDVGILDEVGFKDGAYISTLLLELRV